MDAWVGELFMKKLTLGLLFWGLLLVSSAWAETADGRFQDLAERFLQGYLRLNPELATTLGEHRYDGQWSDYSPEGIARAVQFYQGMKSELQRIPEAEFAKPSVVLIHFMNRRRVVEEEAAEIRLRDLQLENAHCR